MGRRSSGGRGFRSAARRRAPPPAKLVAAPVLAPHSNGSVMGGRSFLYSLREGFSWGAGNSLGHRIVDFVAGPRTIQVCEAPSQAPAPAPATVSDACDIHKRAFADCISQNGSDISRCQFFIDMLNQCRRDSHGGIAAATALA